MHRFPNPFIGAAAAEIAVHGLCDLLVGRARRFREQRCSGHDLSGLAVATLRDLFGDPSLLQYVQAVGSEALNRSDAFARDLRSGSRAGANRVAIDMDSAGAAQSRTTAEFGSGEFEGVAENPEQRRLRRDADLLFTAVDAECDVCHVGPVVEFGSCPTWYPTCGKREMADGVTKR